MTKRAFATSTAIILTSAIFLIQGQAVSADSTSQAEVQQVLDYYADQVSAIAGVPASIDNQRLATVDNGFTSVVVDTPNRALDVYWKGQVPTQLAVVATAMPTGFSFSTHQAAFSRSELLVAAAKISAAGSSVLEGDTTLEVSPEPDGSGLIVSTDLSRLELVSKLESVAQNVEVKVSYADNSVNLTSSRNADAAPFSGGAYLKMGSNYCTSGFPVMKSGTDYILTAGHCFENMTGTVAVKTYSGSSFGSIAISSSTIVPGKDIALINPTTSSQASIYIGGLNSTTKAAVKGAATNRLGDLVCIGGANYGSHCAVIIDRTITVTTSYSTVTGALSGNTPTVPYQINAVDGDSGAPVYSNVSGGVAASGILFALDDLGPTVCSGVSSVNGVTYCGNRVVWTPISSALSAFGATLQTR